MQEPVPSTDVITDLRRQIRDMDEEFISGVIVRCKEPQGGHTSISLTGMLVREKISATQKNRMTLNSNPQKTECPKIQTQTNRMTQDAMFVKVWINMKSYYDFVFQYCVFFIQRIQVCDTKIGRPTIIKIGEILRNPEK